MSAPTVCILAGGLGSRLGAAVKDTPKPLLPVAGRPFLDWQLELLAAHGVRRVVLCVGYLGERIQSAIGSQRHGIDVVYRFDPPDLAGTAGAVRGARDALGDAFEVLYGDTYLRVDYAAVWERFLDSNRLGLMTVLRNAGEWDTSNVVLSEAEEIVVYDKRRRRPDMQWIDYGLSCLRAEALDLLPDEPDLAVLFQRLAERQELAAYVATERFYEIGTPAALAETDAFLRRLDRQGAPTAPRSGRPPTPADGPGSPA
jgi:NDP-sugar pyrophosphorylase family protein